MKKMRCGSISKWLKKELLDEKFLEEAASRETLEVRLEEKVT